MSTSDVRLDAAADVEAAVLHDHDLRGVLRIAPFRRLWTALSLSSLGDWLGLLALTAMAPRLASGGYAAANLAVAGVFILRLAPAIIVGPIAGVVADRLDRRWTMVVCDVARFLLFLSIPFVATLWWLYVATFLIEVASLLWIPAKEATVPNLVPRERLETANQLSLFTTYGSAPVAAALFAGLALLTGIIDNAVPELAAVDLALYVNAATFLVSAFTIARLTGIPARHKLPDGVAAPSVWATLVEGWTYVGRTRLVRGLVVGMLGAFAAGGAVIGLARTFVADLGGGDPGYGLLFGTVFLGLAGGMFLGPRLLPDLSRSRIFGLAIGGAGVALAVLGLIPNLVVAVVITLVIGAFAGVAWVTGYTLLGLEVADELRGRTFAFVQTMVRVVLVLVLAVAPLLAAALGRHRLELTDSMALTYNGAAFVFLLAGLLAASLGLASFRAMDDRKGVPLWADLATAVRSGPVGQRRTGSRDGFFLVLEGGEGAGKSTQARAIAQWLESLGHDVVVTHEPGATEVGRRLRSVLLDLPGSDAGDSGDSSASAAPAVLSPRTEALLFAADRAEHVAAVIRPALESGHVVISDRYADSSVAYQGAGRDLSGSEVARLSRWASDGLFPQLTVLLDLSPADGLARVTKPDRLESEPLDFHERVRERFLELAHRGGADHLVLDATLPLEEVTAAIQARLEPVLPLSARQREEIERERLAEEERQRVAVERRRVTEEAARAAKESARVEAEENKLREAVAAEARLAAAAAESQERETERREQEAAVAAERTRLKEEQRAAREAALQRRADEQRGIDGHRAESQTMAGAPRTEQQRAMDETAIISAVTDAPLAPGQQSQGPPAHSSSPTQALKAPKGATAQQGARSWWKVDPASPPPRQAAEPETQALSLTDELFSLDDDDDQREDQTVQMPRADHRRDER